MPDRPTSRTPDPAEIPAWIVEQIDQWSAADAAVRELVDSPTFDPPQLAARQAARERLADLIVAGLARELRR